MKRNEDAVNYERSGNGFVFTAIDGTQYHKQQLLGFGSYGEVYLAKADNGHEAVIKVSVDSFDKTKNEMAVCSELYSNADKRNVAAFIDEKDKKTKTVSLMPLIEGNESNWLGIERGKFDAPLSHRMYSLVGLFSQFQQLHNKGYIHGDVKIENMLMTHYKGEKGEDYTVPYFSLIDFGLSKKTSDGFLYSGRSGTKKTIAPEVYDRGYAYFASDIYSASEAFKVILEAGDPGKYVSGDFKNDLIEKKIGKEWSNVIDFNKIGECMVQTEPYARPTASELVILFKELQNYFSLAETFARYEQLKKNAPPGGEQVSYVLKSQLKDEASILKMLQGAPKELVRSHYVRLEINDKVAEVKQQFCREELVELDGEKIKLFVLAPGKSLDSDLRSHFFVKKEFDIYGEIEEKWILNEANLDGMMNEGSGLDQLLGVFPQERKALESQFDDMYQKRESGASHEYDQGLQKIAQKLSNEASEEISAKLGLKKRTDNQGDNIGIEVMNKFGLEKYKADLLKGMNSSSILIKKLVTDLSKGVLREGLERVVYNYDNAMQLEMIDKYQDHPQMLEGLLKQTGVVFKDGYTLDNYIKEIKNSAPTKYSEVCLERVKQENTFLSKRIKEFYSDEELIDDVFKGSWNIKRDVLFKKMKFYTFLSSPAAMREFENAENQILCELVEFAKIIDPNKKIILGKELLYEENFQHIKTELLKSVANLSKQDLLRINSIDMTKHLDPKCTAGQLKEQLKKIYEQNSPSPDDVNKLKSWRKKLGIKIGYRKMRSLYDHSAKTDFDWEKKAMQKVLSAMTNSNVLGYFLDEKKIELENRAINQSSVMQSAKEDVENAVDKEEIKAKMPSAVNVYRYGEMMHEDRQRDVKDLQQRIKNVLKRDGGLSNKFEHSSIQKPSLHKRFPSK